MLGHQVKKPKSKKAEPKFLKGAADGKHYWLTPPDLYAKLDAEFRFDFDPCPYPCDWRFDGLRESWGSSNYVNPPFMGPTAWVRKAISEYKQGKKVVFVFPLDKWALMMLAAGAEVRNLGDVKWCATEDGLPGEGTGRHIACFILDPDKKKPESGATQTVEQPEHRCVEVLAIHPHDDRASVWVGCSCKKWREHFDGLGALNRGVNALLEHVLSAAPIPPKETKP
jgi:hypothetical protein